MFVFPSCQASDWEKLQKTLADALEHYNELHAVMDLVLFEEAIQHVYDTHVHAHTHTRTHIYTKIMQITAGNIPSADMH